MTKEIHIRQAKNGVSISVDGKHVGERSDDYVFSNQDDFLEFMSIRFDFNQIPDAYENDDDDDDEPAF